MAVQTREFTFDGVDGEKVFCYRWSSAAPTRGVLQIAHGMGEHALRYLEPLTPLIESGIVVYANDHRGHGRTAGSKDRHGDFGKGGFPALVEEMAILSRLIRKENPGQKLILLGHSMGSFAFQIYLLDHSALIDGAIISGSAALDLLAAGMGQRASLDTIGAGDAKPRTPFDWLSRDEAEVDKYIADPLCGFSVNDEARTSMFTAGFRTTQPDEMKKIKSDLPIYLFAGDKDPVNGNLEWLSPLPDRYRSAGVKDVSFDWYKDARHEMLNETNRAEVVANMTKWIDRVVAAK
jgi:alpha-beta hydrolase superfamily lysophospholipase